MSDAQMTTEEKTAAAHCQAAYDETGLNGTAINWRYWVNQMPTLTAFHAACLMSALDPIKYATLSECPGKTDPLAFINKARKIQLLAETQGKLTATAAEWVEWAKTKGIKVHIGFQLAVWEKPKQQAGDATKGGAGVTAEDEAIPRAKASIAKPATQEKIIEAFPIQGGWGDKLKKAPSGAYQWLNGTWAHVGSKKPGDATTYYPVKIAIAIAASKPQRMKLAACDNAIREYFPEWWREWESESELLRKI